MVHHEKDWGNSMIDEKFYSYWFDYQVDEFKAHQKPQYIDAAAFKIHDIAQNFSFGINILSHTEKFGNSPCDLLFKTMCTESSLMFFCSCIEYLRQMLFLFGQPDDVDLYNHETLEAKLQNKSLSSVVDDLLRYLGNIDTSRKEKYERISEIIHDLDKQVSMLHLIERYNYVKHRGQFHINGLPGNSTMAFNGKIKMRKESNGRSVEIPPKSLLYKETVDIDKMIEDLYCGYEKLCQSFNSILRILPFDEYKQEKREFGIIGILKCFDTEDVYEIAPFESPNGK